VDFKSLTKKFFVHEIDQELEFIKQFTEHACIDPYLEYPHANIGRNVADCEALVNDLYLLLRSHPTLYAWYMNE
jgi:hypothetical protein